MIADITEEENLYWQEQGRLLFAKECTFMLGVASLAQLPDTSLPEFAFIGRSNVGKSSLINALTGRKTLARTSVTPGRTQQLNFFNLADTLRIVDLPGYGFANAPIDTVKKWHSTIFTYLQGRANLARVFVLIDSRHSVKPKDTEVMKMLDDAAVAYSIIMTKADKVSTAQLQLNISKTQELITSHAAVYPLIDVTSSAKGVGIEEVKGDIAYFNNIFVQ